MVLPWNTGGVWDKQLLCSAQTTPCTGFLTGFKVHGDEAAVILFKAASFYSRRFILTRLLLASSELGVSYPGSI